MKKNLAHLLLLLGALGLAACGGGGGGSGAVYVESPPVNYTPVLRSFDLFDSYDVDTRIDRSTPVTLSPYFYEGVFDLFWRVDSLEDYYVELSLNDRPSPLASIPIYSERCGAGLRCDQAGAWVCEYTSDLFLACETGPYTDISPLFPVLPQRLYLILQICDTDSNYCEFDYHRVWME